MMTNFIFVLIVFISFLAIFGTFYGIILLHMTDGDVDLIIKAFKDVFKW